MALALFAACASSAIAQTELSPQQLRDVANEAQQAYDRGIAALPANAAKAGEHFRDAARRFQLLIDNGVANGQVHYNLGNAHLQSGQLGRAILNYRRAQRFMAGDARLESNLQYARSLCRSQIAPSAQHQVWDSLLAWHRGIAIDARLSIFLGCNVLLWGTLLAYLFWRRSFLRFPAIVLAIPWLAFGASVLVDETGWLEQREGVLIANDVIVRRGNGAGFEPRFEQPLHEGVEFTLLEVRGDWLNIRLPSGDEGWIESSKAEWVH